jgi:transcription initiation factor TFIID TATA-box-binding protein
MLLFGSGKIVCTGGKNTKDVSTAVEELLEKLTSMGLLH